MSEFVKEMEPGKIYKSKRIRNNDGEFVGYVYFVCKEFYPQPDQDLVAILGDKVYKGVLFGFMGANLYPINHLTTGTEQGNWEPCTDDEFAFAVSELTDKMKEVIPESLLDHTPYAPPMLDAFMLAVSQMGVMEKAGEEHNEFILEYFREIGHEWVKEDELAWCGAFVNWVLKLSGYEYTGKLNARSWLEIGEEVKEPQVGDLAIFWRGSKDGIYGHVGFFTKKVGMMITILGGNQNNQVCFGNYQASQLLGYRRMKEVKNDR